jgi:hypothetical protein
MSVAAGFGAYALFYFIYYCFANRPSMPSIVAIQLPGLLMGIPLFKKAGVASVQAFKSLLRQQGNDRWLKIALWMSFGVLYITIMARVLAPAKTSDSVVGYLETSRWIFHHGLKTFDPYNTKFSTFPILTEVIYSLSFAFDTEIGAKVFDAMVGFTFLLLLYGLTRRYTSSLAALGASFSVGAFACMVVLFGVGKVDFAAQFNWLAAMALMTMNNREKLHWRSVFLSAFIMGVAISQKYSNLILMPIWGIYFLHLIIGINSSFKNTVRNLMLTVGIFIAIAAPHYVKNYIWTGNPIAPFNNSFFTSTPHRFLPHHHHPVTLLSLRDSLLFPYTLFVKISADGTPYMPFVLLIGLGAFCLFFRKQHRQLQLLSLFWLIQLIIWIIVLKEAWMVQRFSLGFFAMAAIFAFAALHSFMQRHSKFKIGVVALLTLSIVFSTYIQRKNIYNYKFVFNKLDRKHWDEELNNGRASFILKAARLAGPNKRLFILNNHHRELFYIPFERIRFVCTELEKVEFDEAKDPESYLKKKGFKYLLVKSQLGYPEVPSTPKFLTNDKIVYRHPYLNGTLYKIY